MKKVLTRKPKRLELLSSLFPSIRVERGQGVSNFRKVLFSICLVFASLPAFSQYFYDASGNSLGRKDGNYFYDASGNSLGRIDGNYVYDASGNSILRIDGSYYYDGSGNTVGRVDGNYVYDASGNTKGRIDGNYVYDSSGNSIGRVDGIQKPDIILFYFFCFGKK
jgi:uncharacterized protein RhaS with RHS repeats